MPHSEIYVRLRTYLRSTTYGLPGVSTLLLFMAKIHTKDNLNSGQSKLSQAEKEILNSIKEGHTSDEIADQRKCSIRTVEKHRSNIIRKLGLSGKPNTLMRWALLNMK